MSTKKELKIKDDEENALLDRLVKENSYEVTNERKSFNVVFAVITALLPICKSIF
jgi:hypothetical protein